MYPKEHGIELFVIHIQEPKLVCYKQKIGFGLKFVEWYNQKRPKDLFLLHCKRDLGNHFEELQLAEKQQLVLVTCHTGGRGNTKKHEILRFEGNDKGGCRHRSCNLSIEYKKSTLKRYQLDFAPSTIVFFIVGRNKT